MRLTTVIPTALVAALLAGCGDSGGISAPAPRPTLTGGATSGITPIATAAAPPAATVAAPDDAVTVEVTGIVGTVSVASRTIEIRRLQGAEVVRLEITPRTVIHRAGGGSAQLRDIKPSDRLVAKGSVSDRRDTLVVSEITVQDILPGVQPGG